MKLITRALVSASALLSVLALAGTQAQAAINPGPASSAGCGSYVTTIDVSRWQGDINWSAVRASGIAGAWIKTSGGDGGLYTDGLAGQNIAGASAAGLPFGTYHFAGVYSYRAGWQEANYAVDHGFGQGPLPPTLDLETNPSRMSGRALDQWALDFAAVVAARTGRATVIYTGAYLGLGNSDGRLAALPLWIANYGSNSPGWSACGRGSPAVPNVWRQGWSVWQFNSSTRIPGISANTVDMDVVTPEAWHAFLSGGGYVAPAAPSPAPYSPGPGSGTGRNLTSTPTRNIQRIVGVTADGVYGAQTTAAVRAFQARVGVAADGVWGPQTQSAADRFLRWIAAAPAQPTLRTGSSGASVRELQTRLDARGFHLAADGVFGAQTAAAVRWYQTGRHLVADGIVGPRTWGAL